MGIGKGTRPNSFDVRRYDDLGGQLHALAAIKSPTWYILKVRREVEATGKPSFHENTKSKVF